MSKPANVVCDPVSGVCRYVPDAVEAPDTAPAQEESCTQDEPPLIKLLGPVLKSKSGSVPTSSLSGPSKVLGLYFSAHWCGPCRHFTPVLAKFYKQFKKTHPRKDDFEIVFVSSDSDNKSFNSYYGKMPWLALPYEERDRQEAIFKKFRVQGIPTLIVLDAETGEVITNGGTEMVAMDPTGKKFPWIPRPFSEIIDGDLISADGKTIPASEALKDKVTLLYFSAHWCPPCQAFTPRLASTYKKLKEAGKNVEVVFVSDDEDAKQFNEYLSSMPWLALPYEKESVRDELNSVFDVEGIPTLVVVDTDGTVINANGRRAVDADPDGAEFPWKPKPRQPLEAWTDSDLDEIHDVAVLLLLGSGDIKSRAENLLQPLAEAHKAGPRAEDLNFAYGSIDAEQVTKLLKYVEVDQPDQDKDLVLLVNGPEECKYVFDGPEVTKEALADIVDQFLKGDLPTTSCWADSEEEGQRSHPFDVVKGSLKWLVGSPIRLVKKLLGRH